MFSEDTDPDWELRTKARERENIMNPQPKKLTYENPAYLAYIRKQKCLACPKKAIAHHESGLGIGLVGGGNVKKCSDLGTVPLCPECHGKREDMGYITFWLRFYGMQYRQSTAYHASERLMADGIVMREIIRLQQEWIKKCKQ